MARPPQTIRDRAEAILSAWTGELDDPLLAALFRCAGIPVSHLTELIQKASAA